MKNFFFNFFKLQKYKLVRIKDFPESVAIGLSWGVAISFTPLLGFHLVICYLGTLIMRGNIIAATVGTIVGNPWTFPVFFYVDYKIGTLFFFDEMYFYEFKISFFIDNFDNLFFPTLVGSIPLAIAAWFSTYYLIKKYLDERSNEKNKTWS
tara:strand:+ start:305 stop:757 length:453 start_codon:yes stop_codon:yes gene_type:complete